MKYAIIALLGTSQAVKMHSENKLGEPWDCTNSPTPDNDKTCWADEAYQRCAGGRQSAYDAVMKAGGSS